MKLYNHLRILLTLLLASTLQYSHAQKEEDYFITLWDLSLGTSANNSISFRSSTSGNVNYTWETIPTGQSGSGTFSINNGSVLISKLPSNSKIKLKILPQNLQKFYFDNNYFYSSGSLIDVLQWGTVQWTSMQNAFAGCYNLNITATDVPDLSKVSSMNRMFQSCSKLNGPANIGTWNTQNVSDMSYMFERASSFNQAIGTWNTQNVTDMGGVFTLASAFNQAIGNWNTQNVINMGSMFWGARSFNQAIGNWNTQNVSDMSYMFYEAIAFNQAIGNWNTQNVSDMSGMFTGASSFNQAIGNWNTQNVINMGAMFWEASAFNQAIGNWNTQNVINMGAMFWEASAFNQAIGNWKTQNVINMIWMFSGASAFNQAIGNWNTQNVRDMGAMFRRARSFNQAIGNWNTQNVRDMSVMFYEAIAFNQAIGTWNTQNVTKMYGMFRGAGAFNQAIGTWNIKNVNDMSQMLDECGMDCNKYSLTLSGWAQNPQTPSNLGIGSSKMRYSKLTLPSRNLLTKPVSEGGKGWTIFGDEMVDDDCGLITSTEENWVSTGWSIYPNPAQELLYIKNIPENTAYQIIDAMGREVQSGYCNDEQIALPKLSQGLYSLRIGKQQKHFVKE